MTTTDLDTLAALIKQERHGLLSQWRQQVRQLPSARQLDTPTLNDHIPSLLDELVTELQSKSDQTIPEALSEGSPPAHGIQRLHNDFDNAISLAGRVLELKLPAHSISAETGQMLRALRHNVQQLEGLVGKVLEENTSLQTDVGIKLARREFDLWPLVEALIHDLHPVAGTGSTQLVNKVPDDLVVYADASLLRRVFQNLIANAIRYTPCGAVVIGARENSAARSVECWVSDNGAGIPEALLEKVFDKGETDAETAGGTGLGLAIVKTMTEAHGGTVAVDSKERVGSTFRFSLPAKTSVSGQKSR